MIKANVVVDFPKWKKKIKNPEKYIQIKIRKLNKIYSFVNKKHEFSILLTNKSKMKNLNYKFRKKNKSTDVLSFPSNNNSRNDIYIGDIAIGFEFLNKKSEISKFQYEFDKLWIHGYLHLIGYDHKNVKDYKKMIKKEKLLFKNLNK
tara:strand:- start:758 stop:1198 length:441 start_codon:yes stop_codon:yes gene_type:complete